MNLDPKVLLNNLINIGIHPSIIREILQAAFGMKVSRTSIPNSLLPKLIGEIERHSLFIGISKSKYFASPDSGKGGWCNAAPILIDPTANIGEHFIYVGNDPQKVLFAMYSEEAGSDVDFAGSLGIPACCSDFYTENIDAARGIQNDLFPFSFKNTKDVYPFNVWTNITSQYFGYGLTSYFPCSFNCSHTADLAKASFDLLDSVDVSFASNFLRYQKMNYLYTEYDGVFAFEDSTYENESLYYDSSKVKSTCNGVLQAVLKRGDSIIKVGKQHYQIRSKTSVLMDFSHELACLLVF